jgi:cytosine/adenosine deaminase-related metal-dependent hydrolase
LVRYRWWHVSSRIKGIALNIARTRLLIANPMGTLEGASVGYRAFAATTNPPEIMARAELTLDTCLAQGTVAIRSHTNIESEGGLRGIEAMIDLRERCRRLVRVSGGGSHAGQRHLTPLLGRDEEIAMLKRARQGDGQLV